MKKFLAFLLVLSSLQLTAQTLFRFGNDSVSVKDFLRAYQKNNSAQKSEKAFLEYLDLYIASRLKIAEAVNKGLDTLPQMVSDMQSLRQQLVPSYLIDRSLMRSLADEAFRRSQKDIHLAHIFISAEKADELTLADRKKEELLAELNKKGAVAFAELAKKYSDDPSARENGGDMGWITVFSLPYELENLAYATAPGKVSAVHRSRAGYHIFKNLEERKARGRIRSAQILFAFQPGAGEADKRAVKKLADSVYNRLLKGDDFNKLVRLYSNDVISAASNGQVPEFGVGEYDAAFENAAFSLVKDGDISRPVLTAHGYHIIKRLKKTPVATENDPQVAERFLNQIELNDRIKVVKTQQYNNILKQVAVTEPSFTMDDISLYADSMLNYVSPKKELRIKNESALMVLSNRDRTISKTITAADWLGYAQVYRFKSDGSGSKDYPSLWKEFLEYQVSSYYEKNLEVFNDEFRQQLREFSDGNLFFEVMQQNVWGPAQTDTVALFDFYQKNKEKYVWNPGADAVIFFADNAASARSFITELSRSPASWQELATDHSDHISADSARFEMGQIPGAGKAPLKKGMITSPVINSKDKTASFAYIINIYTRPEPRNFADAKGLVISDFQNEIERNWIRELNKKYRVEKNQVEIDKLLREKKWM